MCKIETKNNVTTHSLYKDCESCDATDDLFIYGPKNQLNEDLFQSYISSELLKKDNITVATSMTTPYLHAEFYCVENICLYNDTYNRCNECQLLIPIDMQFYSNKTNIEIQHEDMNNSTKTLKDKYNLCKECYKNKINTNLHLVKVASGIDNISDWIHIFTIKIKYDNGSYVNTYCYEFYCNLNVNSMHYNKFASVCYISMLGDAFRIIEETYIEQILNKYLKIEL